MKTRAVPWSRTSFPHRAPLDTRWGDNDAYGHLNNVVYYSLFDTLVNAYLVDAGALDIAASDPIGVVVESGCTYFSELAFPQRLEGGLRANHLGRSSVRYELAVFAAGAASASAQGHFVHVYVDRASRRPTALPAALRAALERVLVPRTEGATQVPVAPVPPDPT